MQRPHSSLGPLLLPSDLDPTEDAKMMLTSGAGGAGPPGLEHNLPELIKELGYGFTAKAETCRNHLMRMVGGGEALHANTIAR